MPIHPDRLPRRNHDDPDQSNATLPPFRLCAFVALSGGAL